MFERLTPAQIVKREKRTTAVLLIIVLAMLALIAGAPYAHSQGIGEYFLTGKITPKDVGMVLNRPHGARPSPPCIHAEMDDQGTKFVQCGALRYMVDDQGHALSNGYHEFKRIAKGRWLAQVGAVLDLLEPDGSFITGGFHEVVPTDSGYRATLGASVFFLNHEGRLLERR